MTIRTTSERREKSFPSYGGKVSRTKEKKTHPTLNSTLGMWKALRRTILSAVIGASEDKSMSLSLREEKNCSSLQICIAGMDWGWCNQQKTALWVWRAKAVHRWIIGAPLPKWWCNWLNIRALWMRKNQHHEEKLNFNWTLLCFMMH